MTNIVSESTILTLQFTASLFMAADYFFNDKQRRVINEVLASVVKPIQSSIDRDLRSQRDYVVSQLTGIVIALLFVGTAWIGIHVLPNIMPRSSPIAIGVASLLFLLLFAGGMPRLTELIVRTVVPVAMASSLRLFTSFLLWCPKGTIFGIGFLLLLASFFCRYLNLPA